MRRSIPFVLIVVLGAAVFIVSIVAAQSSGGYDLTWSTIAGGGGSSSGGGYRLDGTVGQSAAGSLSGGGYTLNDGFSIEASSSAKFVVYLPAVLK